MENELKVGDTARVFNIKGTSYRKSDIGKTVMELFEPAYGGEGFDFNLGYNKCLHFFKHEVKQVGLLRVTKVK